MRTTLCIVATLVKNIRNYLLPLPRRLASIFYFVVVESKQSLPSDEVYYYIE